MIKIDKIRLREDFSDTTNLVVMPFSLRANDKNTKLIIWERAMHSPEIVGLFSNSLWPQKILDTFPVENGWDWKIDNGKPKDEPPNIPELIKLASGAYGNPTGNLHLSLKIRNYDDRSSPLGGLSWWKDKAKSLNPNSEALTVYEKLCHVLQSASQNGWDLFVEGISITIAKDKQESSYSPTSTLHSDRHHKAMEAGVCSIKEKGFESGGTLSLPNKKMSDFSEDIDLTFENINPTTQDEPAILSESYDLHLFGGLRDEFGAVNNSNGLPHISRDPPGGSARLILLFRAQPQSL